MAILKFVSCIEGGNTACSIMSDDNNVEELTPEQIVLKSDYELTKCADVTLKEAKEIKLKAAETLLPNGFITAIEHEKVEASRIPVKTGCRAIDDAIGGGLRRRCVTEIYGESGCGKTQIALQIAVHAADTDCAVYICTEEAFPSKRLQQMFQYTDPSQSNVRSTRSDNIFIMQIQEVEDLLKCLKVQLPRILQNNASISVVILDSIAAPFRGCHNDISSTIQRAESLKSIGIELLRCAKQYDVAVLCINQVSANIVDDSVEVMVPCLGLIWSNMITMRIRVKKTNKFHHLGKEIKDWSAPSSNEIMQDCPINIRQLQVIFSPYLSNDVTVDYIITTQGVVSPIRN